MSSWRPAPSVAPGGWGTAPSDACCNWKPGHPKIKAPGRAIIFPKHTATTFLEEGCLLKIHDINKGMLFDLLPTNFLNVISIWHVGIEHSINLKADVT